MRLLTTVTVLSLALSACGGSELDPNLDPAASVATEESDLTAGPTVAGCPVFPASNIWNRDVSHDPVDPTSARMIKFMGREGIGLNTSFGHDVRWGATYTTVPGNQPRVPMKFEYAWSSDPGPYPYPPDLIVQGASFPGGDRHAIVIDRDRCILYETYRTYRSGLGWSCGSGAVFNLRTGTQRPDGWTSADAAGLPLFPRPRPP